MSRSQRAFAWGFRGGVFEDLQPQVVYVPVKRLGEDRIAVMDEEAEGVVSRNRFTQLLERPCRRGVSRHIAHGGCGAECSMTTNT